MRHHPLWFRTLSFLAAMVKSRLSSSAAYIRRRRLFVCARRLLAGTRINDEFVAVSIFCFLTRRRPAASVVHYLVLLQAGRVPHDGAPDGVDPILLVLVIVCHKVHRLHIRRHLRTPGRGHARGTVRGAVQRGAASECFEQRRRTWGRASKAYCLFSESSAPLTLRHLLTCGGRAHGVRR